MGDILHEFPLWALLLQHFREFVAYFEAHCPFTRFGQLEYHRETIGIRAKLGTAAEALSDEQFQRSLYRTLKAWGIGARASRLRPFGDFAAALEDQVSGIADLEGIVIDQAGLDVQGIAERLWSIIDRLNIVENTARLVPATKALHHVLPDLVVPMDREYTQRLFGWQNPQFQYGQRECFTQAFMAFVAIARQTRPAQYVGIGWNTSQTKVLDNAVVGLIRFAQAHASSGSGQQAAPTDERI